MSESEEGGHDARHSKRAIKKKLNDIKLIRLVRANRSLYEADDADYHNQLRREEIWQEIASQMGRKMDDCRRRWFNIRDCFRKSILKRQTRNLDGDFSAKPIRFEKEIAFMVPHLRNPKRSRRLSSRDGTLDDDPLTSVAEYMEGDVDPSSPEFAQTLAEEEPDGGDVEAATEIHDILQELVSWRRQEQATKRDHIRTYFKSIEETVRTLPRALQIEAKKRISSLVFDLELKASGEGKAGYEPPEPPTSVVTD